MSLWDDYKHDYEEPPEDKYLYVEVIQAETDKAIGVHGTDGKMVWLPKSQISVDKFKTKTRIQVPAWLANQKPTLEFE